jgi:Raf kinase inhibitor-like YbhB/YbcL family protein
MPTPGSHSYDVQRTRLRGRLETEGVNDKNADETANRIVQRDNPGTPPGALSDRAAGPYGERTVGGDAGNVIPLRSPAFNDNTLIPARCSRDGDDRSPALEWDQPPEGTVELALLCEDLDAPEGPFLHWLVTGITPDTTSIGEGETPAGAEEWQNDYGDTGYGGPQPPIGDDPHRYVFRLFALDAPLGMSPGAEVQDVRAALDDRRLATGTLTGLFAR